MQQNTLVACRHINSVNIVSKHNKVSEYFAFHSWYQYLWPDKLYRRRPCSTSQSLIVESKDALQAKQNSQSMLWCSSGPTRQETNSRQLYNPSYIYNNDLISVREQSAAIWDNNPNAKLAGNQMLQILLLLTLFYSSMMISFFLEGMMLCMPHIRSMTLDCSE